jgi:hypothetical protein
MKNKLLKENAISVVEVGCEDFCRIIIQKYNLAHQRIKYCAIFTDYELTTPIDGL